MQHVELVMTGVVVAAFVFGLMLGGRGKKEQSTELNRLKPKLSATDGALTKALEDIRQFRLNEERNQRDTDSLIARLADRDKILERIENSLKGHQLTYDKNFGIIQPLHGEDYKMEVYVTRRPLKELEERDAKRKALEEERYQRNHPRRPAPQTSPSSSRPRQTNPEVHYATSSHNNNSLLDTVTAVAITTAIMDSNESSSRVDSTPCYSQPDTVFDSSPCSTQSYD